MLDLKVLKATLDQLEEEKNIPREKIIEAIELALATAYKRDFGKRGQIVRAVFNLETGDTEFTQIKVVVDDSTVKPPLTPEEVEAIKAGEIEKPEYEDADERPRFESEKHIFIEDARKIKAGVELGEEIIFPLEPEDDFGRIAAQTAKQVIIQRIREAEKTAIFGEYSDRQGEIVSGTVQKVDRGNVLVDFDRVTGMIPKDEQIPGEYYKTGQRIKAYLYAVEETSHGISLKLSRSHPRLIEALFALESPEVASGTVELKNIAREAGDRSKIAVMSNDENIDPIGACVGQKGIRVMTVTSELSGEKIDIIPWAEDPLEFVANALAPAHVLGIEIDDNEHIAHIDVADHQLSLAIGKGGQNVRLAAKLTGWKIDIRGVETAEGAALEAEKQRAADELAGENKTKDTDTSATELSDLVSAATSGETDTTEADITESSDPIEEIPPVTANEDAPEEVVEEEEKTPEA
ncbi:MAG: N utilization substance protein A [Planctomycetota bacterium]|jgi:N utilization substance protein A